MMNKTLLIIALLFIGTIVQAAPNYQYVEIRPGETYINTTTQTQQIRVRRNVEDKSKVEKFNSGVSNTANTLNNTLNSIRAITSIFGLY